MDKNVDCVYVALNHHVHYEYLKKLIMFHKPILCEKPFTLNAKETKKIIDLARKEKTFVSEAMWTWHNEPALRCKEWLKEIGDVKTCDIIYSNPFMYILPLKRLNDINLGGGALLDSGVYPITYAYRLFGYPKEIKLVDYSLRNGVDSKETIEFTYEGFKVNIICNLVGKLKEEVKIVGKDGMIIVPDFHFGNKAILIKGEEAIKFKASIKGYYPEIVHTEMDLVNQNLESSYVPLQATYDCMKIMDELRKQMKLVYPKELR